MDLKNLIDTTGDLPTIPVVATKVMQLVENESTDVENITRIVNNDPAIAARVMKISNSVFYSCQRQVQSLQHAISMIGLLTLKSIVIAASLKEIYTPYGLTEKMLWEHSIGTALAARHIASDINEVNIEEAFIGGLFHDIGKIIMNFMDKTNFKTAMERVYNEEITFTEAEQGVFSYTHEQAGALIIKKWNFHENTVLCAALHHLMLFDEDMDIYTRKLVAVVALANAFTNKAGIGSKKQENITFENNLAVECLNITTVQADEMFDIFIKVYNKDISIFS